MNENILIVEDDKEISSLLSGYLSDNGYRTECAYDGREALKKIDSYDYNLILLDLMLPYVSGNEIIEKVRKSSAKNTSNIPIIVISAKSVLETRLEVLKTGADDYILKPFNLDEVLVRMQVVLRRSYGDSDKKDKIISVGELKVYPEESRVAYKDKDISLTSKELQLLILFVSNPKKTFSKANLYETVWQDVYYYEDNTINVHVSNLRSKLKKASGQDYIETVWGIGYRLKISE